VGPYPLPQTPTPNPLIFIWPGKSEPTAPASLAPYTGWEGGVVGGQDFHRLEACATGPGPPTTNLLLTHHHLWERTASASLPLP